jgi:TolB-like protein
MTEFLARLKQRKLVQWALAYIAASFALIQVLDVVAQQFGWPETVRRGTTLVLVVGFFVVLVLAWYHGERGVQRVGGTELLIIALLLAIGGGLLWHFTRVAPNPKQTIATRIRDTVQSNPGATKSANAASAASSRPGAAPMSVVQGVPIPAKSIAVLPFENLSTDKGNAYFADGMQDLILTKLADIGDLKVISRTSTEKYASHPDDLKTIAQQLGVATILEGTVQKAGNQVLINVQLIDARTDGHLWAQSYQRTLDNVFGVEGEVAGKVADALKARLTGEESANLAAVPTRDQTAMDLYLRAEYEVNRGYANYSIPGFETAIPLYRQAVRHDPGFVLAYARLAIAESNLAWFIGYGGDSERWAAQARRDSEQALKLAPRSADAWLAVGYVDYHGQLDFPGALKAFDAALALRPDDPTALGGRGFIERAQGRVEEAIASLGRAAGKDPRDPLLAGELGSTYMMAGRYPEAERWLRRALAIDPDDVNAQGRLAFAILSESGDLTRALAAAQGDAPALKVVRCQLLTYSRRYAEALALVDSVSIGRHARWGVTPITKALIQANLYRLMGDGAKARPLFEQALAAARAQVGMPPGLRKNRYGANVRLEVADALMGLGNTGEGLRTVEQSFAFVDGIRLVQQKGDELIRVASLYSQADRGDLAVPILARVLASPVLSFDYPRVLLRFDPEWDPIRKDPRFQALLKKYAKYKPAMIPTAASPAGIGGTHG